MAIDDYIELMKKDVAEVFSKPRQAPIMPNFHVIPITLSPKDASQRMGHMNEVMRKFIEQQLKKDIEKE